MNAPKSWREVLPVHPAADLFPLMSREELLALGEDIKKAGLQHPVTTFELDGKTHLLDGRNRLDAMELMGLPIDFNSPSVAFPAILAKQRRGFDPYVHVISANLHRRHLTAEQRREVIGKLLKAKPEKSNRQIAEQVKADDKTVASVRRDLEATAEIPQLEKTTGKDGRARKRPAPKPHAAKQERARPSSLTATAAKAQEEKVTSRPADADATAFARLATRDITQSSAEQRIRTLAEEKRAIEIRALGMASEVEELKAEIVKLEAQVAELKAELARLKAASLHEGIPDFLDRRQSKPASGGEPSS